MRGYMQKRRTYKIPTIVIMAAVFTMLALGVAAAAERMAVKAAIANLRNGAGTNYKVLWQVEKYHPFIILKKNGTWYEVKDFEGDTAWIHNSLLDDTRTVITVKPKCNVRAEPTTKSDIVLKVEQGVPFKVIGQKGNWLNIEHADGETGWIHKSLVW